MWWEYSKCVVGFEEVSGGMRGGVWWKTEVVWLDERKRVVGYEEECGWMRGRVWWDERKN